MTKKVQKSKFSEPRYYELAVMIMVSFLMGMAVTLLWAR